jgi:hypothetical protein
MSKKNKSSNRHSNNNHYEMDLPEVINMDDLSYAADSDLHRRNDYLVEDRIKAIQSSYDPGPWEVELAYVHRELDIRRKRLVAHEKFMRSNPELFMNANVDSTDSQDFENLPN